MKKQLAVVIASVMALGMMAGTAMADAPLKVGFSQYAAYNNWRVTNTDDINRALKEAGYDVIFADANDDTAQQISDLEDMIAQQPDYLVIGPREQECRPGCRGHLW